MARAAVERDASPGSVFSVARLCLLRLGCWVFSVELLRLSGHMLELNRVDLMLHTWSDSRHGLDSWPLLQHSSADIPTKGNEAVTCEALCSDKRLEVGQCVKGEVQHKA